MEDIEKLKDYVKDNLDKETQIEMRLFDNKNGRVAYKRLTLKEILSIETGMNVEWNSLNKEDEK